MSRNLFGLLINKCTPNWQNSGKMSTDRIGNAFFANLLERRTKTPNVETFLQSVFCDNNLAALKKLASEKIYIGQTKVNFEL